ncbi:MAG: hypothetical protein EAZ47_02565 [Bacteroidetes bacterium]|nr:MAG: hypothetical protein EAZ47_02565 [Bacteroidota bacterium]
MTTDRKLKILFGLLSIGLLATLIIKLTNVPGGMILSGLFLGGLMIIGIILGCLILTGILRLVFKRTSFLTILFVTNAIAFLAFHYQLYSPTLTIKVPNGYKGEINLVLSNMNDNILTVDTNGIGYLNKWTFNKTYTKPIVVQMDGKSLEKNLVGFNSTTFFGKGKSCCINGQEIESLSFEIVPDNKIGQKQHYSKDLTTLVNTKMVQFSKLEKHTIIQTETINIDTTKK